MADISARSAIVYLELSTNRRESTVEKTEFSDCSLQKGRPAMLTTHDDHDEQIVLQQRPA